MSGGLDVEVRARDGGAVVDGGGGPPQVDPANHAMSLVWGPPAPSGPARGGTIRVGSVTDRLPMFPLNAVLFPGVSVPLKVFEDRYRAMVHHLLREP
ncbi:MAG TPA: LON peptidase substrate-binding domain-containing protein, partial [Nocardioides sp.]|nr:LON peptidase substrate-binding domain-containing protein [Nocardioides sp.]